jgi:hypothetical protein
VHREVRSNGLSWRIPMIITCINPVLGNKWRDVAELFPFQTRPFHALWVFHKPGTASQYFQHVAILRFGPSIRKRPSTLIAGTMSIVMARSGVTPPQTNPRISPIFTRSRLGVTMTEAANSTRAHAYKSSYTAGRKANTNEYVCCIESRP